MTSQLDLFNRNLSGPWITGGLDVQYRLEQSGSLLNIFFQCSVSKSDWFFNFQFGAELYKDMKVPMKVHAGFAKLWHSVRDDVMKGVAFAMSQGATTVEIAGYSQGAALATLCHEDVGFQFPTLECNTVAFGSPRVFWMPSSFIKDRFLDLTRTTVRGDLVTILPPLLMGYCHVGQDNKIGPDAFPAPYHHEPLEYQLLLGGS